MEILGKSSSNPFLTCTDEASNPPKAPKDTPSSRRTPVTVSPLMLSDFSLLSVSKSFSE